MNRTLALFLVSLILPLWMAEAQLRVTSTEKLPLDRGVWTDPDFSWDGKLIYYTASGFNGIWEYSLRDQTVRQLTADPGSGYGFALSRDGKHIAYRRTSINAMTHERLQEIVVQDLVDGTSSVIDSGPSVSVPTFSGAAIVYSVGNETRNLFPQPGATVVLGIEDNKIALSVDGDKTLLDPIGGGSYIWPSLSPDGTRILAYEMERGTLVCDLRGNVLAILGRRDAPAWSHDGKWIVFMRDADDGHNLLSSDIWCISPDGHQMEQLTNTSHVIELNPKCSPTENMIICNSLDGDIYLLSYEEEPR